MNKKIRVESIPSIVPGWFDPKAPKFKTQNDWSGTRIRFSIPVGSDPNKDLEEARQRLSVKYKGADLHLVPDFQNCTPTIDQIDTTGTDEELLKQYFRKVSLPEHVSSEQIIAYLKNFLSSVTMFGVQRLEFESLTSSNVLSFEQCDIDFRQKGLTSVTGWNKDWERSNGAGKSNWVSLPFIALFGKTFKGQSHDGWANQNNNDPARVELNIRLHDKRLLNIQRQSRPGLLRVFLDGTEVTMGKPYATQTLIERLTNLTWEVLTNAVYIGQREIGSVFGTEKDRKELFSRLLGLDRFLIVQDKLRKTALRIQRSVEVIESEISSSESCLTEAKDGMSELQRVLKETPKVSESVLKQYEDEISELEKKISDSEKERNQCLETESNAVNEMRKYEEATTKSETKIQLWQKQLERSSKAKSICITCGNVVDVKVLKKYQTQIEDSILAEEKLYERAEEALIKARQIWTSVRLQFKTKDSERTKWTQSVYEKKSELVSLHSKIEARNRIRNIIEGKKKRVSEFSRILHIHKESLKFTLEEKKFLDICVNAVGRNGLPAYLCSVVTPSLNAAASRYSEKFSEGEIGIQFAASNGDVDMNICNIHGGIHIKDQSAGELRMASIIAVFSFRDVLVPMNLLILDEPSEGLDAANSIAFAKGLHSVVERFHHIIVISHNSHFLGAIEPNHKIEIVKKDKISTASIIS